MNALARQATPRGNSDVRDPEVGIRVGRMVVAAILLWPLLVLVEFRPWHLFDADNLMAMGIFLGGFLPPAHGVEFLGLLFEATLQTLAIATAGTAIAFAIATPLAIVSTRTLSVSRIGPVSGRWRGGAIRSGCRIALALFRSVPEIVWALMFVRVLGLGPAAGVLALAITYGGMLGKVYVEILESTDPQPAKALLQAGSGRLVTLIYGLIPGAAQELTSYTVYRWECAIRASVVMGFVGAGGLGQLMDQSIKMLNGGEVASILLVFVALVLLADALSSQLRESLD